MFNLKKFKQWLDLKNAVDELPTWADEYTDPQVRADITQAYRARYYPVTTPWTDPAQYDPLSPPPGWRYDPHNECWIRL